MSDEYFFPATGDESFYSRFSLRSDFPAEYWQWGVPILSKCMLRSMCSQGDRLYILSQA